LSELQVARNANQNGFYVSNCPTLAKNELDHLASALNESVSEL